MERTNRMNATNTRAPDTGALIDTIAAIVITSITALMVVGIGSYVTRVNQKQWTRAEALRIIDEYTATARRVDCIQNYHIEGCKPKCTPDNLDPTIDGVLAGSMVHFAKGLTPDNTPQAEPPYCLIPTGILATPKTPLQTSPMFEPDVQGAVTGRHSLFLYKYFVGMGDTQATGDEHESLFDVEWVDYYLVEPECEANRPPRAAREITVTWQEASGNSNERSITRTALGPAVPNTMGWHAELVASPDEADGTGTVGGTNTIALPDALKLVDTVHIDDETMHKLTRGFIGQVLDNLPNLLSAATKTPPDNPITGDTRNALGLAQDLLQGDILNLPSENKDGTTPLEEQRKPLNAILQFLGIREEERNSITGTSAGADSIKGKLQKHADKDDKIKAGFLAPVPLGYEFYVNTSADKDSPPSYELVKYDPENPTDTAKSNIDLKSGVKDEDIIRGTVYGTVADNNKREVCAVVVADAGSTVEIPASRRPKVDQSEPQTPKTFTFYPGGAQPKEAAPQE